MSSEGAAAGDCSSAPFGKFLPSHQSAQPGSLWWARHEWRCIHEPGRRWSGGRSAWWQPQCLLHKLPATPKKVENHERGLMVVKLNKDNWSLTQNCERILSSLCLQVLGSNDACRYSPAEHRKTTETRGSPHLSVIQVTEPSDDLLLVQLVSFELHTSNGLHGAVILQALLPSKLRLLRRALF